MNASPRFEEPYDVPSGYFDEELLLLEAVRRAADDMRETALIMDAYDARRMLTQIVAGEGTRETFLALIRLCTCSEIRQANDETITGGMARVADRVKSALRANERSITHDGGRDHQRG